MLVVDLYITLCNKEVIQCETSIAAKEDGANSATHTTCWKQDLVITRVVWPDTAQLCKKQITEKKQGKIQTNL